MNEQSSSYEYLSFNVQTLWFIHLMSTAIYDLVYKLIFPDPSLIKIIGLRAQVYGTRIHFP